MLILTTKDIQYCQLTRAKSFSPIISLGIFYRGFLFIQVSSFSYNQFNNAIERCRKLLEGEQPVTTLIIKEKNSLTLWCEAPELKLIVPEREPVSHQDNASEIREETTAIEPVKDFLTELENHINKRKNKLTYRGAKLLSSNQIKKKG